MSIRSKLTVSICGGLISLFGVGAAAQDLSAIEVPDQPLIIKSQGAFFVGGELVQHTAEQSDQQYGAGQYMVNQMYVEFQVPQRSRQTSVILMHGGGASGREYQTTPDGRMGWNEYFLRKGFPVYLPDQVGVARSGFDKSKFNDARSGMIPPSEQPLIAQHSAEGAWTLFRYGPYHGVAYPDTQFPVEAETHAIKFSIPMVMLPESEPNPNFQALADLSIDAGGAVIVGHSQSGNYPFGAALANPAGVKGMIMLEGACQGSDWTDDEINQLAKIPMLIVFGDYVSDWPAWIYLFESCKTLVQRVSEAGGDATLLELPKIGINGNDHMMMFDKNHIEVADVLIDWIDEHVDGKSDAGSSHKRGKHGKHDKHGKHGKHDKHGKR